METSTIILLIASAVIVGLLAYTYYVHETDETKESFSEPVTSEEESRPMSMSYQPTNAKQRITQAYDTADMPGASTEPVGASTMSSIGAPTTSPLASAPSANANDLPRDKIKVEDLLPKDAANSKWAQANPAGQGDADAQNYLSAGFMMGVNTVGPTLRNANMQLRSDPPIERVDVGPWNKTTIEYDSSRKFFEIGEC